MAQIPKIKLLEAGLYLLGFLFLLVLYRTAWLCDDAYISYRTVDNFINGYGLTFNPGQRVQAFTHPLWVMLHIPFRLLSEDVYHIGLLVACLSSITAVFLLISKLSESHKQRIFLLLALIFSASFMDYSTSGLENPMTNLLLALLAWVYLYKPKLPNHLFLISLISGLMLLNRMDSILLAAPILCISWWKQRSMQSLGIITLGMAPFLLWELFALIYYGFPFPMSAYAKLNTAWSMEKILSQGLHYFLDGIKHDPLTMILIASGLTFPFMYKRKELYPISIGLGLYLLYILYIGGDFMRGRFFCSPYLLSLIVVGRLIPSRLALPVAPLVVILGLLANSPPIFSHTAFGQAFDKTKLLENHGITDERAYYFPGTGLIAAQGRKLPDLDLVDTGNRVHDARGKVYLAWRMGFIGYYAGPEKHIADYYALTDPFLAQLPNVYRADWRPGHFQRIIPRGYLQSIGRGTNELISAELKEVYAIIERITKAPLWDKRRFQAIWKINCTSSYDQLIDRSFYHLPVSLTLREADLESYRGRGLVSFSDAGLKIQLEALKKLDSLELWLQNDCLFSCVFRNGEEIVKGHVLQETAVNKDLSKFLVPGPEKEIDNIIIYPTAELHPCKLQDIRLKFIE